MSRAATGPLRLVPPHRRPPFYGHRVGPSCDGDSARPGWARTQRRQPPCPPHAPYLLRKMCNLAIASYSPLRYQIVKPKVYLTTIGTTFGGRLLDSPRNWANARAMTMGRARSELRQHGPIPVLATAPFPGIEHAARRHRSIHIYLPMSFSSAACECPFRLPCRNWLQSQSHRPCRP